MPEGGRRRARPAGGARSHVCIPASCPPMRARGDAGCCADRRRARADAWRTCAETHAASAAQDRLRRARCGRPGGRRSGPADGRGRSRRRARSRVAPSAGRPSSRYRRRALAAAPPSGTTRSLPPFPVTRTMPSSASTSAISRPHASAGSQAAAVQELDHRPVAQPPWLRGLRPVEEPLDLRLRERRRKPSAPGAGPGQARQGFARPGPGRA